MNDVAEIRPIDAVVAFLASRRSSAAKAMTGPGPTREELRAMIGIASRVPDHGKLAPWRFISYGAETRRRLGERFLARAIALRGPLSEAEAEIERTRFSRAPAVVAVVSRAAPHPKIPEWEQVLSSGAAAYNLLLAANAHGWDAQWLTEWIAYDTTLRSDLGLLKDGERIVGFLYIGRRTLPKTERDRPSLDSILSEV